MARQIQLDAIVEALGRIKYPGYDIDIVTLGLIDELSPTPDGGVTLRLRQPTQKTDVMREIGAQVHHELVHELGIKQVNLQVRKLEPELGDKTGRVRLEGIRHIVAVA